MTTEIGGADECACCAGQEWWDTSSDESEEPGPRFENAIFREPCHGNRKIKNATVAQNRSSSDQKSKTVFLNSYGKEQTLLAKNNTDASVQAGVGAQWGGKGGTTYDVELSGTIKNKNGNFLKGDINQNSKGQGSANLAAGYEKTKNNPPKNK